MSAVTNADQRADRIAARATGFGAGLIAFMLTWIIAARITERLLDSPNSAYVAMAIAISVCVAVTLHVGHRLVSSLHTTRTEPQQMDRSLLAREQAPAPT